MSSKSVFKAVEEWDLKALRKAITKKGADINAVQSVYRNTPLIIAASKGSTEIVQELVRLGADLDIADRDGYTALMIAAMCGFTDIAKVLLSHGATVDLRNNNNGKTALDLAQEAWHQDVVDLFMADLQSPVVICFPPPNEPSTPVGKSIPDPDIAGQNSDPSLDVVPAENISLATSLITPDITFYDDAKEKRFSSKGGHFDFDNGVEVSVPSGAVPPDSNTTVSVQPCFATKNVFQLPQGIDSASPSYLFTGAGSKLTKQVTLTMEHHVNVETQKESDDLLFLQADTQPKTSDSKTVYQFEEVPDSSSEFKPGENKGKLTTRRFSKKIFKIGRRIKKFFHHDPNLYTVRVYNSSPETVGDRISIFTVCLYGRLYSQFLEVLDNMLIPRDYPISSKVVDRTTIEPVRLIEQQVKMEVISAPGWMVEPDKLVIPKRAIDYPETEHQRPEELHNYPPKIVCRFFPQDRAPERTRCTLSFTGFDEEVNVQVPLKAPIVQRHVNIKSLQEATESLRTTAVQVEETQLATTVDSIVSLMDRMSIALRSSTSLEDLAEHTDSIKVEVQAVIGVSRKVVEECSIPTISDNIENDLTKMEALCHQLCQVTKVKFKHCQDQSEETIALEDLVNSGANLMRTFDSLLKNIHTLNNISKSNTSTAYTVLVKCGEKVVAELAQEPKALALSLFSAGFITERTLEETNQLPEILTDKATRLYTEVLRTIKIHPNRYTDFISTLRHNKVLYSELLQALDIMYQNLVKRDKCTSI